MAQQHGKDTVITLDGDDLSAYSNSFSYERSADSHDTTTYGKDSHVYTGGLKDGTATIEGIYETGVAGPRAVIAPLLGTTVPLVYKPEGTGTGKPQDTVDVVVTAYNESSPVAEMIQWTCELQLSDDVVTISQT